MANTKITSREFNQDTAGAKRAACSGPVYITDRGRPSHVLMSFEDFQRLAAKEARITDLLSEPAGVADIEFHTPRSTDPARPTEFG